MRKIKYIAVHCSSTDWNESAESIKRYWREELKHKNLARQNRECFEAINYQDGKDK
jgi:hypothetical protein